FPTRTWLAQRQELVATERKVAVLSAQNAAMTERVQRLNTDAEIERLARQDYNLVRPGEEAYAILPSPAAPRSKAKAAPPEDDPGARRHVHRGRGEPAVVGGNGDGAMDALHLGSATTRATGDHPGREDHCGEGDDHRGG